MTAADVIAGKCRWAVERADALEFVRGLPDDSVDLLMTSPPYEAARTYGVGFALSGEAWVAWMVELVKAAAPKVKGAICINCEGQTRDYSYSGVPHLLFADLKRAGFNMRKTVTFHRVGIPGSGGPDWFRGDTEPVICVTRPGKLPWSDNTACGHPPKWAPGGEMSHRLSDGKRRTQWGGSEKSGNHNGKNGKAAFVRPSHKVLTAGGGDDGPGLFGTEPAAAARQVEKAVPTWLRPGMHSGVQNKVKNPKPKGWATKGSVAGDTKLGEYDQPTLANPGNLLQARYTADEVAAMLSQAGDVLHTVVGGGCMGHPAAHDNEAPYPLDLPTFFIKSLCPPDGIVLDPFVGSGTTIDAAIQAGRRGIGADIRQEMVDLTRRRMETVTPSLPGLC